MFHSGQVPSPYPGALPPPVSYPPTRRGKRGLLIGAGVVAAIVAVVAAFVLGTWSRGGDDAAVTISDASATTAIQGFLDALTKGDDETVARNSSCGFFDAVKDRQSDMTLAKLTSDAFRAQYSSVTVSTIDKIVSSSASQAQVLFTMRAVPAGRSKGQVERQGLAQLLVQDDHVLVCSYLPRNTGQF